MLSHYLKVEDLSQTAPDMDSSHPFGTWKAPRGDMIYLGATPSFSLVGILELRPELGSRGRHCHLIKQEYFYIITGELRGRYWLEDHSHSPKEILHTRGHFITINPGLYHEFIPLTPCWVVELSPQPFDRNDVKYPQ